MAGGQCQFRLRAVAGAEPGLVGLGIYREEGDGCTGDRYGRQAEHQTADDRVAHDTARAADDPQPGLACQLRSQGAFVNRNCGGPPQFRAEIVEARTFRWGLHWLAPNRSRD